MTKLFEIAGIGEAYAKKLEGIGISTIQALLEKGASPKGRKEIADETDSSEKVVLKWLNRAGLARGKGVGEEYPDLLQGAGVDAVPELAQRNGAHLHAKMVEVNEPPAREKFLGEICDLLKAGPDAVGGGESVAPLRRSR